MKVDIHAQSIEQVLNADVINIEDARGLSPGEKSEATDKLVEALLRQSELLMQSHDAISSDKIRKLAEETNRVMREAAAQPANSESRKLKVGQALNSIKECLGSTSGILLNAVKVAQILGA